MRALVSGSSGLVGRALVRDLIAAGHSVGCLIRPQGAGAPHPSATAVRWDPLAGELDQSAAEGAEAIIHLAGASIAAGRWSPARKRVLRESRVDATRQLVAALARLRRPPRTFISASAVGYYGSRGDEDLAEASSSGSDFLATLARDWEAEAARAAEFGARVVFPRFGVILAARGGALQRMLLPFRLGLGGRLGRGEQWMSWLTLEEAVGIARFALENSEVRGPVNAVAPNPVRNREFTRVLGRVLRRPTIFPAPAFALRLALGEMADALLLSSQRALPQRLKGLGYAFRHPELEPALRAVLRSAA